MDKKNIRNVGKKSEVKKKIDKMEEKLMEELDAQKKYGQEMKAIAQNVQAEFENFRKRMEKEKIEFVKFASTNVVSKLLPVVDSFELALLNKTNKEEFAKGIEMIYQDFMNVLENEGIKKIEACGKEFDPRLHEALLQEESDKDNIVLQELQAGYMFNDKILRHVKVKIGKKIKKGE